MGPITDDNLKALIPVGKKNWLKGPLEDNGQISDFQNQWTYFKTLDNNDYGKWGTYIVHHGRDTDVISSVENAVMSRSDTVKFECVQIPNIIQEGMRDKPRIAAIIWNFPVGEGADVQRCHMRGILEGPDCAEHHIQSFLVHNYLTSPLVNNIKAYKADLENAVSTGDFSRWALQERSKDYYIEHELNSENWYVNKLLELNQKRPTDKKEIKVSKRKHMILGTTKWEKRTITVWSNTMTLDYAKDDGEEKGVIAVRSFELLKDILRINGMKGNSPGLWDFKVRDKSTDALGMRNLKYHFETVMEDIRKEAGRVIDAEAVKRAGLYNQKARMLNDVMTVEKANDILRSPYFQDDNDDWHPNDDACTLEVVNWVSLQSAHRAGQNIGSEHFGTAVQECIGATGISIYEEYKEEFAEIKVAEQPLLAAPNSFSSHAKVILINLGVMIVVYLGIRSLAMKRMESKLSVEHSLLEEL